MWLNMNFLYATYVDQNKQAFLAQMMSFVVQHDIIDHSFPINSQYLMMGRGGGGVDSPAFTGTGIMQCSLLNF